MGHLGDVMDQGEVTRRHNYNALRLLVEVVSVCSDFLHKIGLVNVGVVELAVPLVMEDCEHLHR